MPIGEVKIGMACDRWRVQRHLLASNAHAINREGEEDVGVAQGIVVEEVSSAGAEGVRIQCPSADRNGDTELVLLVALASQHKKACALLGHKFKQRTGNGRKRRRLVEAAIGGAQYPRKFRNSQRSAESRARRVFADCPCEVRKTNASVECQPVESLELIFHKKSFEVAARNIALAKYVAG